MKTLSMEYTKEEKENRLTDNNKINIYLHIYNLSSLSSFFLKRKNIRITQYGIMVYLIIIY